MPSPEINRRDVLSLAVAAGTASALLPSTSGAVESETSHLPIIDTNVTLFQWPFRRLPLDRTDALVAKLRSFGVTQAWAGSFEGLLHRDIASVNERLAAECADYAELVPIGSVSLNLPNWEDDLRRCVNDHNIPGIRLHPNYHGYTLSDPRFRELLVSEQASSAEYRDMVPSPHQSPASSREIDRERSCVPPTECSP